MHFYYYFYFVFCTNDTYFSPNIFNSKNRDVTFVIQGPEPVCLLVIVVIFTYGKGPQYSGAPCEA